MPERHFSVSITSGTIITAILLGALVAVLFYLSDLVLVLLTAIVLASAAEPAVKWFIKYKIPRALSVLLVYVLVFGSLFGIVYLFIPPILDEAANFTQSFRTYLESLNISGGVIERLPALPQTEHIVEEFSLPDVLGNIRNSLSGFSSGFLATISAVFGGVVSFVLIIVFSFYFAAQETGIDDFLRVVTPPRYHEYVVGLWRRSQEKIGKWMQGQLILALIIGILTYLGLTVLGVRYALLLSLLAAIGELIPVFGMILAAVPAIAIGFADGGTTLALLVLGLYIILQQFESNLIYPLVVKKVVGVPPLLVILALIVGAKVAGFLGILLSVPIAAALQEFVSDVQKKRVGIAQK